MLMSVYIMQYKKKKIKWKNHTVPTNTTVTYLEIAGKKKKVLWILTH